tara:strand:- start:5824 stop:6105 length:282 start_codon:yes stop_codon:yes gene_type:complete
MGETIPNKSHRRRNVLAVEPHPNRNDVAETLAIDRDTNQFQLSTESSSSIIANHRCVVSSLRRLCAQVSGTQCAQKGNAVKNLETANYGNYVP